MGVHHTVGHVLYGDMSYRRICCRGTCLMRDIIYGRICLIGGHDLWEYMAYRRTCLIEGHGL